MAACAHQCIVMFYFLFCAAVVAGVRVSTLSCWRSWWPFWASSVATSCTTSGRLTPTLATHTDSSRTRLTPSKLVSLLISWLFHCSNRTLCLVCIYFSSHVQCTWTHVPGAPPPLYDLWCNHRVYIIIYDVMHANTWYYYYYDLIKLGCMRCLVECIPILTSCNYFVVFSRPWWAAERDW